jgi:hypothetical protein
MTPKEKAEELVKKYINADFNCKGCKVPYCDEGCTQLGIREAKQCSLIAVDEILKTIKSTSTDYGSSWTYWEQVKNEINLL